MAWEESDFFGCSTNEARKLESKEAFELLNSFGSHSVPQLFLLQSLLDADVILLSNGNGNGSDSGQSESTTNSNSNCINNKSNAEVNEPTAHNAKINKSQQI